MLLGQWEAATWISAVVVDAQLTIGCSHAWQTTADDLCQHVLPLSSANQLTILDAAAADTRQSAGDPVNLLHLTTIQLCHGHEAAV